MTRKRPLPRKSGILLHISSLPGNYATGDFGYEAYQFADRLRKAGQTYWQILPLNQIDSNKGFSPYSPLSAFAGNTLFINPDILEKEGLIKKKSHTIRFKNRGKADHKKAELFKQKIIEKAYNHYLQKKDRQLQHEFENFCEHEKYWLENYVLFITIKQHYFNIPWNQWPEELKNRNEKALKKIFQEYAEIIDRERYAQFLFTKQWHSLKKYCNEKEIKIFGDVPIYIGYDSADVWSQPGLFKLNKNKEMAGIAGCPPDYFDRNGQLWNMPVYNWDELKNRGYEWWKQRIRKNLEWFDLIRMDHFRGFAGYWEVPGGSTYAKEGYWMTGPGQDLFDALKNEFHHLPFVAEDLGEVDQAVYDLRDRYHFPGMHILIFSFNHDMGNSIHTPHNFTENSVVYTGTHDNNTLKGWYKNDLDKQGKKHLNDYLGVKVNSKNCYKIITRLAYNSIAWLAMIPMQDILGLGIKARMNTPSVENGNWIWRLRSKQFKEKKVKELYRLMKMCNRL